MAGFPTRRDALEGRLSTKKVDVSVAFGSSETHSSGDTHCYPSGWKLAVIVLALGLGTFLVAIDNTIIAVAIPEIATDFKALIDVGWFGSAYLLTVTALQPILGKIYTLFDLKTTYLGSMVVFEGEIHAAAGIIEAYSFSWLCDLCCCTKLSSIHIWTSHCRGWCCRAISRSFEYHHFICCPRTKASFPWYRFQLVRYRHLLWAHSRRRIYGRC